MEINIKEGTSFTSSKTIAEHDTALVHGSGALQVLATPALIALMENAAMNAVQFLLPQGFGTVGIEIQATHSKATLVGKQVTATAVVTKVEGKRIYFDISASDEQGEVGKGKHIRYVVDNERFMQKLKDAE